LEASLKRCRNKEHYHEQGEKIMSKAREFYEALSKNEAMQERAKGLKAADETTAEAAAEVVIAFAKSEGYAFTAEELKDFSKELSDQELSNQELSDEELAAVAGGGEVGCPIIGFTMGTDKGGNNVDLCLCILYGNSWGTDCFLYGR
jgi:predicted ribosomally synthesized peptide with nif11-like leader